MLAERLRGEPAGAATLARRFWLLTLMVLVLAVVSSAVAVRLTAMPYLARQQAEVITAQAQKDARNLDAMFARYRQFLGFVAGRADVVMVAMGYLEDADIVRDYLESMPRPEALTWLALHDAIGVELARQDVRPGEHAFDNRQIRELVDAVAQDGPGVERRVAFLARDGRAHVLLPVAVKNKGATEGVLVAEFGFDLARVMPRNDVAERTLIVPATRGARPLDPVPADATVAPIEGADLAIVLEPDHAAVARAGNALLANTVSAIVAVLTSAMALFAWAGGRLIVRPHRAMAAQKKELGELAAVAQRSNDAISVTDLEGRMIWANPAFERLTGYSGAEFRGKKAADFLHGPDTDPGTVQAIHEARRRRQSIETEILNYARSGRPYWIRISISPLLDETDTPYGYMALSYDITDIRRQHDAIVAANQAIEHQAQHDALTGLPNRRALDLALAGRKAEATLVRIDLDHFKYVNDTMGHAAGDLVLCEVARILRAETGPEDLPVRVGGDEFVILMGRGRTSSEGCAMAERMLELIGTPIPFENTSIRVGASFGVASTRDGLLGVAELIVGADAALYEAKELGRNMVRLYTPALHNRMQDRRTLARELRRAIANEEFEPYFQPQIDADSGELVGVETLVRWHSPELGRVMPGTFLPIVQQLSAIGDVDEIVFRKAIRAINELAAEGIRIPKLSFNVTADRIQNPAVAETLVRMAGDGPRLAFEILESVLVEEQSGLFGLSLDRLRDLGVSIEVDDFGSGHASIIGLMHLHPDVMKIDQRLVFPITRSETSRGLVRQIVGMAKLMGVRVTAEGVETLQHARILQELGCDTLQGHAFARAMPAAELREFARRYRPVPLRPAHSA